MGLNLFLTRMKCEWISSGTTPCYSKEGTGLLECLYDCLARSTLVPFYLRIYMVVIRHYAPNAEGLVHLQKAGSFQHSHRHAERQSASSKH